MSVNAAKRVHLMGISEREYMRQDFVCETTKAVTKQERVEIYRSFLVDEGFAPEIDDDGDIEFKFEGAQYFIILSSEDSEFFHLLHPPFWLIESDAERAKATEAAVHATAQAKVAKVYLEGNNTVAGVEMFCSPPNVFTTVFQRSLRALQTCVATFRERMMVQREEMSAMDVLQKVGELQQSKAQWPAIWEALNPEGNEAAAQLLIAIRGPHMFCPHVALNLLRIGCERALKSSPVASREQAIQEAMRADDQIVGPR